MTHTHTIETQMITMYLSGLTLKQVSEANNCSASKVYLLLKRNGIERRKPGVPSTIGQNSDAQGANQPTVSETVVTAYLNGRRQIDIANDYGVSRQRIHQILKTSGIKDDCPQL